MKLPTDLAKNSSKEFIETFENVYEHSPWIVEQALELVLAKSVGNSIAIVSVKNFHTNGRLFVFEYKTRRHQKF